LLFLSLFLTVVATPWGALALAKLSNSPQFTTNLPDVPIDYLVYESGRALLWWASLLGLHLIAAFAASSFLFWNHRVGFRCLLKWTLYSVASFAIIVPFVPLVHSLNTPSPDRWGPLGRLSADLDDTADINQICDLPVRGMFQGWQDWRVRLISAYYTIIWSLGASLTPYAPRVPGFKIAAFFLFGGVLAALFCAYPWTVFAAYTRP
jgi:hypothetical protein